MGGLKKEKFRGIFAILPTPFRADLSVDYPALESIVDFCVACGVGGIVTPANASEQPMLMDVERQRIIKTAVKRAAGRAAVVAGVTAANAYVAGVFTKQACAAGADALMAMPPYIVKGDQPAVFNYYMTIDKAADVPVIIQNYPGPVGAPMSPEFMLDMCGASDNIRYIKEELTYSSHMIANTLKLAEKRSNDDGARAGSGKQTAGKLWGVMCGKAGKFIIEEFRRGAAGNMPACEIADVHVKIWKLCEEGNFSAAQSLLDLAQPLLNFESIYGAFAYKEVLRRRGVISAAYARSVDGQSFDDCDMKELDRIMGAVSPAFSV